MVHQTPALGRVAVLVLAAMAVANGGCSMLRREKAPANAVTMNDSTTGKKLIVRWNSQVQFGVDSMSNRPIAAVCGQLSLLDMASGSGIDCDGKLVVDLFDATPRGDGPPKQLERWEIDPESVKKFARSDRLLQKGYELNLPWASYTPDISQVHLLVRFEPTAGEPLSTRQLMTLQSNKQDLAIKSREEPAGGVNQVSFKK